MSVFIRRYQSDPGNEVFLEIESVNILDLDPPATISGIGTGTALIVGEFENGPFNAVTEITGPSDLSTTFGELGYRYAGVVGNYPSAVARKADGALDAEYWNGNGFAQLNGKKFRRLICVRADTSIGEVEFTRRATLTGNAAFAYNMEPGQAITLAVSTPSSQGTATFTAAAAVLTSGTGTYNTGFTGGEQLVMSVDGRPNVTVTFLASDQSQAAVIARINKAFGFTVCDDPTATEIRFTSLRRGSDASVKVVSGTPAVLTALGLVVGTTAGTGVVGDIDAVRFDEIKSVIEFNVTNVFVDKSATGAIRISRKYEGAGDYVTVISSTATALGFVAGDFASNTGYTYYKSLNGTYPTGFLGGEVLTVAHDDGNPVSVVFQLADQSIEQVAARINSTVGYPMASNALGETKLLLRSKTNGGNIRVLGGTAMLGFGMSVTSVQAKAVSAGLIPAGTLLAATDDQLFVTMQDLKVSASNPGAYKVKVRHAIDDGTGQIALAGSITNVMVGLVIGSFEVVNPTATKAAMTEGQIDAAYSDAIDATLNANTQARITNVIWSARQSNAIRRKLRSNVLESSSIGMFGRMCITRAPMNTDKALAQSNAAEPGVGAYREQRNIYCYPNVVSFVPQIAARGIGGGLGFTADGLVNLGADGFMASILSQLPPEENPGQATAFTTGIVGIENSPNISNFTINDYINFRAAGIASFRMDDGIAIVQSGVTSVDPSLYPNLRNIARRRMADFIQDTLARRCKGFGKRLNTQARRKAIAVEIRAFLDGLLSKNNPTSQRIAGYSVDEKSGNTVQTLAQGIFRIIIRIKTLSSLDAIVLDTQVGESVEVTEFIPEG